MKLLQGKIALVTGAGHPEGMGFAACRALAAQGATVIVTDLVKDGDDERVIADRAETIRADGGSAHAAALDVTRSEAVDACVRSIEAAHGRIDIPFG